MPDGNQTVTIDFIRHGETLWNREKKIQGRSDIPLSDAGLTQAGCLAQRLVQWAQKEGEGPWRALYSSNLTRARQTAAVAAEALGLEIRLSPLLRERDLGPWEGMTFDELMERHPVEARAWKADPARPPVPGIESGQSVADRMIQFCDQALTSYPNSRILAFSHGAAIGRLVRTISEMPPSQILVIDNVSITTVVWDGASGRVETINDCRHLDP